MIPHGPFQDYLALVALNKLPPLNCPCGFELNLAGDTQKPVLHCYMCQSDYVPGLDYLERIQRALDR